MSRPTQDYKQRQIGSEFDARTLTQRLTALNKADEIRIYRARLKRDLKANRVSIIDVLMDPPDKIETMKLFDLMLAVPKYGRVKVNKILRDCRISPAKPIGELSDRQRLETVSHLR